MSSKKIKKNYCSFKFHSSRQNFLFLLTNYFRQFLKFPSQNANKFLVRRQRNSQLHSENWIIKLYYRSHRGINSNEASLRISHFFVRSSFMYTTYYSLLYDSNPPSKLQKCRNLWKELLLSVDLFSFSPFFYIIFLTHPGMNDKPSYNCFEPIYSYNYIRGQNYLH